MPCNNTWLKYKTCPIEIIANFDIKIMWINFPSRGSNKINLERILIL
jgi:hypothetical protein